MTTYSKSREVTFQSQSAITRYTFLKFGTEDNTVIPCVAGDMAIGVANADCSESGQIVQAFLQGGGGAVKLGGSVTRGDILIPDANGYAVPATSDVIGSAVAMESGVEGDIISVEIQNINPGTVTLRTTEEPEGPTTETNETGGNQ